MNTFSMQYPNEWLGKVWDSNLIQLSESWMARETILFLADLKVRCVLIFEEKKEELFNRQGKRMPLRRKLEWHGWRGGSR